MLLKILQKKGNECWCTEIYCLLHNNPVTLIVYTTKNPAISDVSITWQWSSKTSLHLIRHVLRDETKKSGIECHRRICDVFVAPKTSREDVTFRPNVVGNWTGPVQGPTRCDVFFRRGPRHVAVPFPSVANSAC